MEFEPLRDAMRAAIAAQDHLLSAWRSLRGVSDYSSLTEDDLELLYQLVYRKIYPINAFGVLALRSVPRAIDILLTRYLGSGVGPDNGFGGFTFDMDSMIDDLRLSGGETALRQLVTHPRFNREMLTDPRFRNALGHTLGLEELALAEWLLTPAPAAEEP